MKFKIPFQMKEIKRMNRKHLLVVGLVGVLLLVLALPVNDEQDTELLQKGEMEHIPTQATGSLNSYRKDMEKQLEQILGEMDGVGKVEVMITMKDEGETVLEKDLTQTEERTGEDNGQGTKRENIIINSQEETIYIQEDSTSSTPFVSKEVMPRVEGVVIVAQGGGNPGTVKNISDAVLALFPVEVHKIKVVKMSSS